jgi:alpha-D-ribose 1-methylphosphonate 5-triphosphate synthase subunit PhnG
MSPPDEADETSARQAAMAACAEARGDELEAALAALDPGEVEELRLPETGLVMLRGRMGGDGQPFNVGEATVTRAAVRLAATGAVGHAWHLGRDRVRARAAAVLDALWQSPTTRAHVEAALAPVRARLDAERAARARQAAATRVEFFTLVRGED